MVLPPLVLVLRLLPPTPLRLHRLLLLQLRRHRLRRRALVLPLSSRLPHLRLLLLIQKMMATRGFAG